MLVKKSQHLMLAHTLKKEDIYTQILLRMIAYNFVRNMDNLISFNDYGLSRSNSQHSMSYLLSTNSVYIYKVPQQNISNKNVIIFDNLQQFSHYYL